MAKRPSDIKGLARVRNLARVKAKRLTDELTDRTIAALRNADFTTGAGIEDDHTVWVEFRPGFKRLLLNLTNLTVTTDSGEIIAAFETFIELADVLRDDLPELEKGS